jgi:hypothetical protein
MESTGTWLPHFFVEVRRDPDTTDWLVAVNETNFPGYIVQLSRWPESEFEAALQSGRQEADRRGCNLVFTEAGSIFAGTSS